MRWLLARTGAMIVLLVLDVVVARLIGGLNKSSVAEILKVEINQDQQACWHQICPGQTTLEEAEKLLRADETMFVSRSGPAINWFSKSNYHLNGYMIAPPEGTDLAVWLKTTNIVYDITFQGGLPSSTLGDMLLMFGNPAGAKACVAEVSGIGFGEADFDGNIEVVFDFSPLVRNADNWIARFTTNSRVWRVAITSHEFVLHRRFMNSEQLRITSGYPGSLNVPYRSRPSVNSFTAGKCS